MMTGSCDLSCPAVSHSCRVTLLEPSVIVFIWKSMPVEKFCTSHCVSQAEHHFLFTLCLLVPTNLNCAKLLL